MPQQEQQTTEPALEAATVKAITPATDDGDWVLDVLGAPYGGPYNGKDADGDAFDAETNFWLDRIGKRPVIHYHGATQKSPEIIGQELGYEQRADGVWFRVLLDKANEAAGRIWQAAKQGLARASSGAIQHLIRKDEAGRVLEWPIGELSLLDAGAGERPANPYAVAMPALMKCYKAAGLDLPPFAVEEPPAQDSADIIAEPAIAGTENIKMDTLTKEDVLALIEAQEAKRKEAAELDALKSKAAKYDELEAEVKALKATDGTKQVKRVPQPEQDAAPAVKTTVYSKWDGFSLGQLGLAWDMLKAVKADRPMELYRAMHAKVVKTIKDGDIYKDHITYGNGGAIMRELSPAVTAKAVKAVMGFDPMTADNKAIKSDELHGSDVADAGDEWVPALWSAELWDLVRNEAKVLSRFRQVEVPGESMPIPTLEGKTTIYKTAQTDDQSELTAAAAPASMSKVTTGQTTLTPVKNVAWLGWTGELTEDSILPIMPSLQAALRQDIQEQIDEMLISGDTATGSTNYSDYGNGSIDAAWRLLSVNGLRDYALANSKTSEATSLNAADFTALMAYIGTNGAYALNPDKLIWILDPAVYRQALLLGETLTADKAGGVGTFQSGRLVQVFGSDVIVSDRYGLTDTSGYIHNTTGNNVKGSFLLVRPDRWVVGFGRRVRIESPARDLVSIVTDTQHLIASFRIDFKYHSGGLGAALGYNVTV